MNLRIFYKILVVILFLFVPNFLKAQYYLWGDDPASIKWNIIKGDTYKVIYPRGDDSLAKRYLWLLEENKKAVMLGLNNIKPAKLPVVLHTNTTQSNGFVVWAPKRMELYTLPSVSTFPQSWENQLTIHESRHVGQMTFFTKGIFKLGSYLIGQQAAGIGVALYPSKWMLEGDAVIVETELTNSGRGRVASFLEYYRLSFLQNNYRNWDKWRFGSVKYYSPNMYAFGYLMNSTIRYRTKNYGFQGKIFDGYVKRFYNPKVNKFYYKKETDFSFKGNLKLGQRLMDSIWRDDYNKRGVFTKGINIIDKNSNYYTEYAFPIKIGKDSVIYLKTSYDQATKLVLVSNKKAKNIRVFSKTANGFCLQGDNIYFIEGRGNKRWQNESYNLLYLYNWRENKLKKLTKECFYNSPTVNAIGDKICVAEYLRDGGSNLVILNAKDANIEYKCVAPYNGQITSLAWHGDFIYATTITDKGLGIFRKQVNSVSGEWECIVKDQNANIYGLKSASDFIYFVSDVDGVNNVYKIDCATLQLERLTNSKYGANSAYIYDNYLYYSELVLNGKTPVKLNLDSLPNYNTKYNITLKNGEFLNKYKYIVADELTNQAKVALKKQNLLAPDSTITKRNNTSIVKYSTTFEDFSKKTETKKYNKLTNLFRFHSWLPFYVDIDAIMNESFANIYSETALGATLISQNTLGTAISMFGYSYKNGYNAGHINFTYSGFYPVFKVEAHLNDGMRHRIKVEKQDDGYKIIDEEMNGHLFEFSTTCYVPLNLSSNGWRRGLIPQAKWEFENNQFYSNKGNKFINRQTITTALQYYQLYPVPLAAIFPQWGFGAIVKGAFSPNKESAFSKVSSVFAYGYLPGIDKKQGIKLSVSYQKQFSEGKTYLLGDLISGPRGYDETIYADKFFMGSFDYAAPIYLGDISLGWFAYLQRLQVIPFIDYGICKNKNSAGKYINDNLYSVGSTFMVDCFLLRLGVPFSLGLRYSYNDGSFLNDNKHNFEFMIKIKGF